MVRRIFAAEVTTWPLLMRLRARIARAQGQLRELRALVRELRALAATIRAERAALEAEHRHREAKRRDYYEHEMPALRRACERAVRLNPYITLAELGQVTP